MDFEELLHSSNVECYLMKCFHKELINPGIARDDSPVRFLTDFHSIFLGFRGWFKLRHIFQWNIRSCYFSIAEIKLGPHLIVSTIPAFLFTYLQILSTPIIHLIKRSMVLWPIKGLECGPGPNLAHPHFFEAIKSMKLLISYDIWQSLHLRWWFTLIVYSRNKKSLILA